MLYSTYQTQSDVLTPLRIMAQAASGLLMQPQLAFHPLARPLGAACELLSRAGMTHTRPPFGIHETKVEGNVVPVEEDVVWKSPFCNLLNFRKSGVPDQPRVLIVAPMSGHFSTLLRGTARTMVADHDTYITDWLNAREVSLVHGRFDFDDYVDTVIACLRHLGPGTHVLAVCQPSVPVLVATALMAAEKDPATPRTMTLMGGPIDTRCNPTEVNKLAMTRDISWFERNVIGMVPLRYAGAFRRVYPGFVQLAGFMSMNLDRHVNAHVDLFRNLVKGDGESAELTRTFYDEYMAVMDLPAEFYLQTIHQVFQQHLLPKGLLTSRGRPVDCRAITRTGLLTVEGERDDICAVGQTAAAHDLCSKIPLSKHEHHLQPGVGHYGVFNGKRWQNEIYPRVKEFILENG